MAGVPSFVHDVDDRVLHGWHNVKGLENGGQNTLVLTSSTDLSLRY
jgi:hypothetical protein